MCEIHPVSNIKKGKLRYNKSVAGDEVTKREEYEMKTEALVMPIIEENNFELVDVEYVKEGGNFFLRVYADKEGGININDCELISRRLSDLLDEKDFIPDAYILEVSSPGLGRTLKKDKDFKRSIGEAVEFKLYKAINKRKDFDGILTDFDAEKVYIEMEDGTVKEFLRSDIALIRLAIDF